MSNHSEEQNPRAKAADLLDGFKAANAEHENVSESQQTGLVLFSFGRRGGFAKPGDDKRGINVVA